MTARGQASSSAACACCSAAGVSAATAASLRSSDRQALRSACLSDDLSEAAVAALTPAALQQAQAALLDAWPRAVILQTR